MDNISCHEFEWLVLHFHLKLPFYIQNSFLIRRSGARFSCLLSLFLRSLLSRGHTRILLSLVR